MTDWHPSLSDADPADAWYPPDKLERQRQAEEAEAAFRRMVAVRDRFNRALDEATHPLTEAERRDLWAAAEEEDTDHAHPED